MNLTLQQPITYKQSEKDFDLIASTFHSRPIGSDACICFHYQVADETLKIDTIWCGEKDPFSVEEKQAIEAGHPIAPRAEETLSLPPGPYTFDQCIPLESLTDIPAFLLPYIMQNGMMAGDVYIRFFKENILEEIMQCFFPKLVG